MSGIKRHRILFINHWARRPGGAEISLLDIMTEALKTADVYLVCSEEGALVETAKKMGINCRIITCDREIEKIRRDKLVFTAVVNLKLLYHYFLFVCNLSRYIARLKPDIIHANIPKSHIALSLLSLAGYDCAYVFHIREIFGIRSFSSMLYSLLIPRKKTLVIAISATVKKALPRRIKRQAVVLYNGVKVSELAKEFGSGKKPGFLYLGRIVPWKGCHLLIDAFYRLFQKMGESSGSLDMVGDTLYWNRSYRENLLNKISDLDMTSKIRLFPQTSNPREWYLSHDILCMASDNEPFGRVAVEAMSCGLPVISFNSGGISEIIRHEVSGFLVRQNDVAAYADTMEKFINNPLLIKNMGLSGYEIVKKEFNYERNIPEIVEKMIGLLK